MDGYEDVGTAVIRRFTNIIETVGLDQFCFDTNGIQIAFGGLRDRQGDVALAQPRFFVYGTRIRIAVWCMAGIQEYFHYFSSPF